MPSQEKPNLSDREKAADEVGKRVDTVVDDLLKGRLTSSQEDKLGKAVRDRGTQKATSGKGFRLEA